MVGEMLILIATLIAWTFYTNWNHKNLPKGPFKLPIIGNLHQFALYVKNNKMHTLFMEYEKVYGKIFSFKLGSFQCVVLNDYKLIKEAWNSPFVTGRPRFRAFSGRTGGFLRGVLFQDGDEWYEQRRFAVRHLRELGMGKKSMENVVMDDVVELLEGIRKDSGKPISTRNRFNLAVVNALWTIIAGERFKHDDPELLAIMEALTRALSESTSAQIAFYMPWILKIWPNFPPWLKYKAEVTQPYNFLKKFTDERIQSHDESEESNFADVYIAEIKKTKDPDSSFYGKRGELTMTATLLDLFSAGGETTSTTLMWACLYLSVFEDKQRNLHAEIDRVCGFRLPTQDDRPNMPYTEAVIMETMRYSSMVPLGLVHRTTSSVMIGGHHIPNDTIVIGNLYAVHYDPKTWGDPNYFRPERFLSPVETSVVKHEALIPFSTGRRVCLGETLAKNELFLFLTSIFQKFEVVWDPSQPKPSLEPESNVVAPPKPHKLVFTERNPNNHIS